MEIVSLIVLKFHFLSKTILVSKVHRQHETKGRIPTKTGSCWVVFKIINKSYRFSEHFHATTLYDRVT